MLTPSMTRPEGRRNQSAVQNKNENKWLRLLSTGNIIGLVIHDCIPCTLLVVDYTCRLMDFYIFYFNQISVSNFNPHPIIPYYPSYDPYDSHSILHYSLFDHFSPASPYGINAVCIAGPFFTTRKSLYFSFKNYFAVLCELDY